jgi:hypothetical protein
VPFNCCSIASARLCPDVKLRRCIIDGKPCYKRVNAGDLEINRHSVMGLQLCSGSRHDGSILAAGILNLYIIPM